MAVLVLFFPRLGIQLARRKDSALAGKPLGLLVGEGESALLAAVSVEATADGVEQGMTALQARQRCPAITFERDNASECIETLEGLLPILRSRATTNVAIVSRDAIALSLAGMEGRFTDEGAAAHATLTLVRTWSGLDVRGAVAGNIKDALCSARKARRFPVISGDPGETVAELPAYEPVTGQFTWESPVTSRDAAERLTRMASSLQAVMSAYGHSYRSVRVDVSHGANRTSYTFRSAQPMHRASEALDLIRERLDAGKLDGATGIRLSLEKPGPMIAVEPWRTPVATMHQLSGPAIPVQRRLLRAS